VLLTNDAGDSAIESNVITGGTGNASAQAKGDGSRGLFVRGGIHTAAQNSVIMNNIIEGGHGTTGATPGESSVGVGIELSATADLVGNYVSGGSGTGTGRVIGVHVKTSGNTIARNRIYGGDVTSGSTAVVAAVRLDAPGGGQTTMSNAVVNNLIHGGNHTNATLPMGAEFDGIAVANSVSTNILFNTVFGGGSGGGGTVHASRALALETNNSLLSVRDNFFFAIDSDFVVVFKQCPDANAGAGLVSAFDHNAFIGAGLLGQQIALGGTCSSSTLPTIDSIQADLGPNATANTWIADACSGTGCIVDGSCTTDAACVSTRFPASWGADLGYGALFAGSWHIKDPCPDTGLANGASAGSVTMDFFMHTRAATPTRGAEEQTTTCP
jgi:hypothetical protein